MGSKISRSFLRRDYAQENSELFDGHVEVAIAPPFNAAQLLRVTRHMENRDIRIRRTSGSWKNGVVITASLEKPLPLVDVLRDSPTVDGVRVVNRQERSSDVSAKNAMFSFGAGLDSGLSRVAVAVA